MTLAWKTPVPGPDDPRLTNDRTTYDVERAGHYPVPEQPTEEN